MICVIIEVERALVKMRPYTDVAASGAIRVGVSVIRAGVMKVGIYVWEKDA